MKARPRIPPEKDRRDRGPPPEQWRCPLAIAQRLVHRAVAVSTAVLGKSHKDNVRCSAVEEQLEAKEVQRLKATQTARRNTDCSANKEPNNCSVTAVSKTDFGKELARAPTITISPPPV